MASLEDAEAGPRSHRREKAALANASPDPACPPPHVGGYYLALTRRALRFLRVAWANATDFLARDFQPSPGRSPAWFAQAALPLCVAALMMLTFVTIQPPPYAAESEACDADPSLSAVLHYARAHRLQFGTDLAYTYGPLGFLVFADYFPHAVGLHLCTDVALSFAAAAGLCLVAWRLHPFWRSLLLAAFVYLAANIQYRTELMIQTGLFCWGWLCLLESGRQPSSGAGGTPAPLPQTGVITQTQPQCTPALSSSEGKTASSVPARAGALPLLLGRGEGRGQGAGRSWCPNTLIACTVVFTAFAVFCALAKVSSLFIVGASVLLLAVDLWLRGHRRAALGLVTGAGVGFVLGWVICGQNLSHIGPFLMNAVAMVQGYAAALGWEQPEVAARICQRVALLFLVLVPVRIRFTVQPLHAPTHARRALLLAWVLCFAVAAWKHGVVRWSFDYLAMCLTSLTVIAFCLDALPCPRPGIRLWTRLLAIACCLVTLSGLRTLGFMSLSKPFVALSHSLRCLTHPGEYERSMNVLAEANRRRAQLPTLRQIVGNGTVDVFGRRQAYAILNDLNYRPRPLPQSYACCNAALMRLNETFYLSEAAPDYVLFELSTLDRRFPSLDDAWVLRDLCTNYQPVASEGLFLLLKRASSEPPRFTLLREADVRLGQPLDLRSHGETNLWLEIDLKPTWSGWLQQLLWRPPTVRLAAWRSPGHGLIYRRRAPPAMLSAGFLISPLLLGTADTLSALTGSPVVRPGACSIELLPGEQRTVHVRIYRIENPIGRGPAPERFNRLLNPAWPPPAAARTKGQ